MNMGLLINRAVLSLRDPQGGARWVLAQGIPRGTAWELLVLVLVLSTALALAAEVVGLADPVLRDNEDGESFTFVLGLINMAVLTGAVFLIDGAGRMFGGKGDQAGAVMIVVWLQFILMLLQVVQYAALIALPPLAALISLFALIMVFWLPTNFIAELHGFTSRVAVFFGLMAISIVVLILVSIVLASLGLDLTMEGRAS